MNPKLIVVALAWIGLLGTSSEAAAQWKMLKKFVQKDVEIVEETKTVLVLRHPELDELMVVALKGESDEEPDIQADTAQERGGNPYRVWVASEKLWNDPDKPKQVWGRFFRAEFLRILRPPGQVEAGASGP